MMNFRDWLRADPRRLCGLTVGALIACGGCAGGGRAAKEFVLTTDAGSVHIGQGSAVSIPIHVLRFEAFDVVISVSGLPAGVSADALTIAGSGSSGSLTLHATSSAALQTGVATIITARGGGSTHHLPLSIDVGGAPGSLDASFGTNGTITVDESPGVGDDWFRRIAVRGDGSFVAVGNFLATSMTSGWLVVSRLEDGTADPTFNGGLPLRLFTNTLGGGTLASAVDVFPDGRVAVCGSRVIGGLLRPSVVVLRADGTLDPTFGGGVVDFVKGDIVDCTGVRALPDGDVAIAVTGYTMYSIAEIARFSASGVADPAFGTNGLAYDFSNDCPRTCPPSNLVSAPGGDLVSGGIELVYGYPWLISIGPTGGLDATAFGLSFLPYGAAPLSDLAFDSQSRLVTAGSARDGAGTFTAATARFTSTGELDTSYGSGGVASFPLDGFAGVVAAGDRPLAIGTGRAKPGDTRKSTLLVRFTENGSLDGSFGSSGMSATNTSPAWDDVGVDVALQPDGRIITAGQIVVGTDASGHLDGVASLHRIWP